MLLSQEKKNLNPTNMKETIFEEGTLYNLLQSTGTEDFEAVIK